MATPVLIPVSEYLSTTYRPDRDYVDGELKKRNLGEKPHGLMQGILFTIFNANRSAWQLLPIPEQRIQASATRFRIPDVCLIRPTNSQDGIVRDAPVLCVEVLSPEDSLPAMAKRAQDYLNMGVEMVWMIDPLAKKAHHLSTRGLFPETATLTIPGTEVRVELAEIFAQLDDLLAGRL